MVRILWRFSKTFDQKEKKNTDKNLVIWGFGYLGIWLWIDELDKYFQNKHFFNLNCNQNTDTFKLSIDDA